MKNGNERRDVRSDLRLRYRFPWAEIGKYGPRKEPIRLHDSLPCPLKKVKIFIVILQVILWLIGIKVT